MVGHWTEERPRKDKNGVRWNFTYWHSVWTSARVKSAQRLFFWNDDKSECGAVILVPGATMHHSRINRLIAKLVADPQLRDRHRKDLRFPLDRHYPEYGAFPEEIEGTQ